MIVKQLELGPMQNFIYLIGDPERREVAVVDPGWEVQVILGAAARDGYTVTKVFITHHHFDHAQGLAALLEAIDVPVYVHRDDASHLDVQRANLVRVRGGETVQVGDLPVTLIHTPGHTKGSQCLLVNGRLFSGDTLFIRACGRCDLPGGDARALYQSLAHTLAKLPDDTILCPGHHYAEEVTSTLGAEKRLNPFLRVPTLEEFLHVVGA